MNTGRSVLLMITLAVTGCALDEPDESRVSREDSVADMIGSEDARLSATDLERGRRDPAWRKVVTFDTSAAVTTRSNETWEQISVSDVNGRPTFLPLGEESAGPSVLRLQVLLDRAYFSPGVIDGRWGKNTEKAVYWFQRREQLRATGRADSVTFNRLVELAGAPDRLVREYVLNAADVSGPFVDLPSEIYDAHTLDCTCFESLAEKLAEQLHVTPELLEKLNPGVDLNRLTAGERLWAPSLRDSSGGTDERVAAIVVSVAGYYLHALDEQDRLLYHFPTTLGSGYNPSEGTTYTVTSITENPWWHLQPALLHTGDPNRPDVRIPPGPNNAVGIVWMALSRPHYGIHGTAEPSTIGYATSSGCIRLTNWDARFLGRRIEAGVTVHFEDIPPGRAAHPAPTG